MPANCPFPYVPNHLPDELLYSYISRLHHWNALNNHRETLDLLFGSTTLIPSADLPCHLLAFIGRTADWGPFTSLSNLVEEATLFPYYRLFLTQERCERSLATMAGPNGGGLKISMGLVANGLGASVALRHCHQCDLEMLSTYGCLIWQRMHQLPGVLVCPKHGVWLDSGIPQSSLTHRQRFLPHVLQAIVRPRDLSEASVSILRRIARLSEETLNTHRQAPPIEVRQQAYLYALVAKGLKGRKGVHWDGLAQALQVEYADFDGLPFRDRLLSSAHCPLRWLRDLCQRPSRQQHPLLHLLLIGYLFGTVRDFLEAAALQISEARLVGQGPRPHIQAVSSVSDAAMEGLLLDAEQSCSQVAGQTGLSVTTVVKMRRARCVPISERRKTVTRVMIDRAESLLSAGLPVVEVALRVGVSLPSIYRILGASQITQSLREKTLLWQAKTRHREDWTNARRRHPRSGTNQLRHVAAATFIWLYRHDHDWLVHHQPARLPTEVAQFRHRVDWPVRDLDLAEKIRCAARRMLEIPGSRRVSATALMRATGMAASIQRNLDKLPQTKQAIHKSAEDRNAFVARRLSAARDALIDSGNTFPATWQVRRNARVRS